jgi:hypothetical protein
MENATEREVLPLIVGGLLKISAVTVRAASIAGFSEVTLQVRHDSLTFEPTAASGALFFSLLRTCTHFRIFDIQFDQWHAMRYDVGAGWSSLVARWAHNPKVEGSNPSPATKTLS